MSRLSNVPKCRRQRRKDRPDRAFVLIDGNRVYLGAYGSAESRRRYREALAATDDPPKAVKPKPISTAPVEPTMSMLMASYMEHAIEKYGESVQLDATHIDRSADVWVYRPPSHKTASKGKHREIAIGPKSKAVLSKYLFRTPCFTHRVASIRQAVKRAAKRAGVKPWFPYLDTKSPCVFLVPALSRSQAGSLDQWIVIETYQQNGANDYEVCEVIDAHGVVDRFSFGRLLNGGVVGAHDAPDQQENIQYAFKKSKHRREHLVPKTQDACQETHAVVAVLEHRRVVERRYSNAVSEHYVQQQEKRRGQVVPLHQRVCAVCLVIFEHR